MPRAAIYMFGKTVRSQSGNRYLPFRTGKTAEICAASAGSHAPRGRPGSPRCSRASRVRPPMSSGSIWAQTAPKGTVELNVPEFLSRALNTEVTTAIVAYNDMTVYPGADSACPSLLMGFSVHTPNEPVTFASTQKYPGAGFLMRSCKGEYAVRWVYDPTIKPIPALVAVRAITLSPFSRIRPARFTSAALMQEMHLRRASTTLRGSTGACRSVRNDHLKDWQDPR